jgi:hypothetical protein
MNGSGNLIKIAISEGEGVQNWANVLFSERFYEELKDR